MGTPFNVQPGRREVPADQLADELLDGSPEFIYKFSYELGPPNTLALGTSFRLFQVEVPLLPKMAVQDTNRANEPFKRLKVL